jgi:hypothetical protein
MSIADGLNQFRGAFREELGTLRSGLSDQGGGDAGLGRLQSFERQGGAGLGDYLGGRLGGWDAAGGVGGGLDRLAPGGFDTGAPYSRFATGFAVNQDAAQRQARRDAEQQAMQVRAQGTLAAGDWSGPATADDNKALTGQGIDTWIAATRPNSPLIGQGAYILQRANELGVSVPLFMGILLKESELGTTAGPGFNLAGVTDPGRDQGLGGQRAFQGYGSWQQAIDGALTNLAGPNYKGKSAADQVSMWYVGRPYDPNATDLAGNGTVQQYLSGPVATAYQGLGVPLNPTQGGTPRGGAGTGVPLGAGVPQSDYLDRTRTLIGKVGYTSGGVRSTGNIADGADCSSFAGWLIGADPNDWNAQRLYDVSAPVDPGQLRPGDLVFFNIANPGDATARPVGHVAVWLGNGKVAQSTTMNGTNGVQVVDLANDDWLRTHVYGYGRYARGRPQQGNY